jgi:ArsR family transcriptional regulator
MEELIRPQEFFYLLSDETRLRCFLLLVEKKELCVCDFTHALKLIQPKISRHLAIMKKFNLLLDRRSGTWSYYRINPDLPNWINKILPIMVEHLGNSKQFNNDLIRVNNFPARPKCDSP